MDAMLLCRTCMDFELWLYSYFWADFGIDYRMVLYRVFGMFCVVFVACFVASIGKKLWPVDKGFSGMVSGRNGVYQNCKELSGTLLRGSHAIAWLGSKLKPRNCGAPVHLQASNFGRP